MADKKTSPIDSYSVTLGGKEYQLAYPMGAYWAFEDATGIDFLKPDPRAATEEGRKEMQDEYMAKPLSQRMRETATLLWAGLITHHPEVKLDEVRKMIYPRDFAKIEAAVIEAQRASMAVSEGDEESPLAQTTNPSS